MLEKVYYPEYISNLHVIGPKDMEICQFFEI